MAKLNKKSLWYAGAGFLTIVVGYFVYDLIKTNQQAQRYKSSGEKKVGPSTQTGTDVLSSAGAQPSNDSYPLRVGSYGAKVWVLQGALKALGNSLIVDGKFGAKTYGAIRNTDAGFGGILCGLGYECYLSYKKWQQIIDDATEKGFNVSQSWTNAKKKWQV